MGKIHQVALFIKKVMKVGSHPVLGSLIGDSTGSHAVGFGNLRNQRLSVLVMTKGIYCLDAQESA